MFPYNRLSDIPFTLHPYFTVACFGRISRNDTRRHESDSFSALRHIGATMVSHSIIIDFGVKLRSFTAVDIASAENSVRNLILWIISPALFSTILFFLSATSLYCGEYSYGFSIKSPGVEFSSRKSWIRTPRLYLTFCVSRYLPPGTRPIRNNWECDNPLLIFDSGISKTLSLRSCRLSSTFIPTVPNTPLVTDRKRPFEPLVDYGRYDESF